MTTQLTFDLKNSFAQFLWAPDQIEGAKAPQSVNGKYLVEVIDSLARSLGSKNADAAAVARALHDRLKADLATLEVSLTETREAFKAALAVDILQVPEFSRPKTIEVDAKHVRELTVKFIRVFVVYDEAMHALHEQFRHGMIDKDQMMKTRKKVSQPLRRFMSDTSKLVKLYHVKRRELNGASRPANEAPKVESAA